MKKVLLTLGTIASIAAPVAAVVACSPDHKTPVAHKAARGSKITVAGALITDTATELKKGSTDWTTIDKHEVVEVEISNTIDHLAPVAAQRLTKAPSILPPIVASVITEKATDLRDAWTEIVKKATDTREDWSVMTEPTDPREDWSKVSEDIIEIVKTTDPTGAVGYVDTPDQYGAVTSTDTMQPQANNGYAPVTAFIG